MEIKLTNITKENFKDVSFKFDSNQINTLIGSNNSDIKKILDLIYLNIPVFIEGRMDCYTPEYDNPDIFMEGYKALYSDELMLTLSYKYNFTILILDANSVSTQIFITSSNWRVIDYTNNTIILERNF